MTESKTLEQSRLPRALRLYNVAARGAARLGIRSGPLVAQDILRTARRRTGLEDLGEGRDDVVEALGVLAESLQREAALSPLGQRAMKATLERILEKRLRLVAYIQQRSEVRDQAIRRPIFVIGFPRTGTTLLFNLLAQDPSARPLLGWEAFHPMPDRRAKPGRRDPRIGQFRRALRGLRYAAPELQKVHPLENEGPEECLVLLLRTLVSWVFCLQASVPTYDAWLRSCDLSVHETAYRFHRDQLRLLQTQRGGGHWLLKSPAHVNGMQALANVYPDACIIQTHRDPAKVLASTCSLVGLMRKIFSDELDPRATGTELLKTFSRDIERMLRVRDVLPAERVRDVRYADLLRDPCGMVRRIYEHFGLSVSAQMEAGMRRWLEAHRQHQHGVHRYSLEQFGIQREELDRTSAAYRAHFDIAREA